MRRLLLLVLLLPLASCGGGSESGAQQVALALDFQPNAVHAGIYAAERLGLDEENGVDLEIRVPSASTDSLKLLAAGRADMAVVDIHDLGLARERGRDVVGVGALVQRPLAAVIARSGEVRRPRDLEGRRVGVTGLPSDEALLRAVVEDDGGDFSQVRTLTIGFSAVPALITGRVDAVVSFWNVEGVALRERGVRDARVPRRRVRCAALPRAGAGGRAGHARRRAGSRRRHARRAAGRDARGARRPAGGGRRHRRAPPAPTSR